MRADLKYAASMLVLFPSPFELRPPPGLVFLIEDKLFFNGGLTSMEGTEFYLQKKDIKYKLTFTFILYKIPNEI